MSRCLLLLTLAACAPSPLGNGKSCVAQEGGTDDSAARQAAADCEADGAGYCDPTAWISGDAALCFADQAGVDAARGRERELSYDDGFGMVVWAVTNTVVTEPGGGTGRYVILAAYGGAVVDEGTWDGDDGGDECRGCGDSG